jgi:hypothetical protein
LALTGRPRQTSPALSLLVIASAGVRSKLGAGTVAPGSWVPRPDTSDDDIDEPVQVKLAAADCLTRSGLACARADGGT